MGYILPIRAFEMEQYHNRATGIKHQPFMINEPFPVTFHRSRVEHFIKPVMINTPSKKESQTKKYNISEEKLAELTGKGIHFNEII